MQKIISLFKRAYDGDRLVYNEVVPGAEWVLAGEGIATRKFDGTCCLIRDGKFYKRYDAKAFTVGDNGEKKPYNRQPPEGFEPAQDPDPNTGHWPGWVPVGDGPDDKYHREAWEYLLKVCQVTGGHPANGTFELCGPKVQGNPENFKDNQLIPHGAWLLEDCPRYFDGIKAYLQNAGIEGVVWHHPDGRMVKIKRKDFFKK